MHFLTSLSYIQCFSALCFVKLAISNDVRAAYYCQEVNNYPYDLASNQTYGNVSLYCNIPANVSRVLVEKELRHRLFSRMRISSNENTEIAITVFCNKTRTIVELPWYPDIPLLVYVKVEHCRVYQTKKSVNDVGLAASNIKVLTLVNCVINHIFITSAIICEAMPNLVTLTVKKAELSSSLKNATLAPVSSEDNVWKSFCSRQPSLKHVDFSHNWWFSEVHVSYLSPYVRLQSIDISETTVNGFEANNALVKPLFQIGTFPNITYINLSGISGGSCISRFVDNRGLKEPIVHVIMHDIVAFILMSEDIDVMKKLNGVIFDIRNDYLVCPNHATKIGARLVNEEIFQPGGRYYYVSQLECYTSDKSVASRKIRLSEMQEYCFHCLPMPNTTMASIISLAIVISVLLLSLPFAVHYRRNLLILLHGIKILVAVQKFRKKNCKIYLSFDENDFNFVKPLADKLECEYGYNVYQQRRNSTPGEAEVDEMVRAINQADYAILVCSPSYIKNDWCVEECRQAFFKMVQERLDYMIVLLLDDITNIFGRNQQITIDDENNDSNHQISVTVDKKNEDLIDIQWCVSNCKTIQTGSSFFWLTLIYELRKQSGSDKRQVHV